MKTVNEWTQHWDSKVDITNPVALNGYCVGGAPIDRETYFAAVVDPVIERLDLKPHHCVLDIGCGSGLTLSEIEKRVAESGGTDLSQTMIDKYRGEAKTHVCAAHELPFEGEQFDRILMVGVAVYFPDLEYFAEVAEKAISLLLPDGLFLIGDIHIGDTPAGNQYQWYDRAQLLDYLDRLGYAYNLMSQNKLKRTINRRWDILIRKD